MTLDNDVLNIMSDIFKNQEGNIFLIDNRIKIPTQRLIKKHEDNENITVKSENDLDAINFAMDQFGKEWMDYYITLMDIGIVDLKDIINAFKFKEADTYILRGHRIKLNAIGKVIETMGIGKVVEKINKQKSLTLANCIDYLISGTEKKDFNQMQLKSDIHNYRNDMWTIKYLPFIDESLHAGNTQTIIDFNYIIMSNREIEKLEKGLDYSSKEKIDVVPLDYKIEKLNLEKCAAIFIDNDWSPIFNEGGNLGSGVKTLRKIRKYLDEKGKSVPIIYQSGHSLSDFTEEEQKEIEDLGAVLASKDIFPKVCLGKKRAQKEVEISDIIAKHKDLAKYTTKVFGKDLANEELSLIYSKIEDGIPEAKEKIKLFNKLDINDDVNNHRMYVLAMLHTELKDEVDNPIFEENVPNFYDIEEYMDRIANYYLNDVNLFNMNELYNKIKNDPVHNEKKVISHNDAKEDNWFNDYILGDFANASAGTEYKDIARSLLDESNGFKTIKDTEKVSDCINNYIKIRSDLDNDFEPEDFKQRVYECIFTESLRIGYFKEKRHLEPGHYISISKMYFNLLTLSSEKDQS